MESLPAVRYRRPHFVHRNTVCSQVSSSDVQCLGSTQEPSNLNIAERIAKNIPPLTEFEEEYLTVLLISNCPSTCSILDAQLYLHQEAMSIVKKNYHVKV